MDEKEIVLILQLFEAIAEQKAKMIAVVLKELKQRVCNLSRFSKEDRTAEPEYTMGWRTRLRISRPHRRTIGRGRKRKEQYADTCCSTE